ncbi:hypothetical protein F5B17DRAFT_191911 [Nemania serpens]|nr:hypothetical protein F5B17DRAFT_191911 [Nemania serpens]
MVCDNIGTLSFMVLLLLVSFFHLVADAGRTGLYHRCYLCAIYVLSMCYACDTSPIDKFEELEYIKQTAERSHGYRYCGCYVDSGRTALLEAAKLPILKF